LGIAVKPDERMGAVWNYREKKGRLTVVGSTLGEDLGVLKR